MVKTNAPELLRAELESPRWQPQTLVMSGVTDPYQPIERKLQITRGCLEVLAEFRNPVAIITKNHLVTRDIDLLRDLAVCNAAAVNISVTSLDPSLQRVLEPRTTSPQSRLDAIRQLRAANIAAGVMIAPIIPGLTDHEVPKILEACAKAGAQFAGYTIIRLPWAVAPLFERWLDEHFPERKEKVLGRIRLPRNSLRRMSPSPFAWGNDGAIARAAQPHACCHSGHLEPSLSRKRAATISYRQKRGQMRRIFGCSVRCPQRTGRWCSEGKSAKDSGHYNTCCGRRFSQPAA